MTLTPEERAHQLTNTEGINIDKCEEIRLVGEFKAIYRHCMVIVLRETNVCLHAEYIAEEISKEGNIDESKY